jgi:hypothetical protein
MVVRPKHVSDNLNQIVNNYCNRVALDGNPWTWTWDMFNDECYGAATAHSTQRLPTGWKPWFDSRHGKETFLFSTAPGPAMRPTKPPIHWISGDLSRGLSGRGIKLTAHLNLVGGQEWRSYTYASPYLLIAWCLVDKTQTTSLFCRVLLSGRETWWFLN